MKGIRSRLWVVAHCMFAHTIAVAGEHNLQDLRLFFSPDERNPVVVLPPQPVAAPPPGVKEVENNDKRPISIRYIGAIRTKNKHRLFWKRDEKKYLTTVPKLQDERQSHGRAKSKKPVLHGQK